MKDFEAKSLLKKARLMIFVMPVFLIVFAFPIFNEDGLLHAILKELQTNSTQDKRQAAATVILFVGAAICLYLMSCFGKIVGGSKMTKLVVGQDEVYGICTVGPCRIAYADILEVNLVQETHIVIRSVVKAHEIEVVTAKQKYNFICIEEAEKVAFMIRERMGAISAGQYNSHG